MLGKYRDIFHIYLLHAKHVTSIKFLSKNKDFFPLPLDAINSSIIFRCIFLVK